MKNQKSNRREFLRRCARWSAFGVLAGISGVLIKRTTDVDPENQQCDNRGVCRQCSSYSNCGLPAALSAKNAGMHPDKPGK
jgi:hypothetical protein